MNKHDLAKIIKQRKTIEECVKYVGAYALRDDQAIILGQTCYDDLKVVSYADLEVKQRHGNNMVYEKKNGGLGVSPFFPIPLNQLENPYSARFYNKGMQMLLDAGLSFPESKLGYPEITEWKVGILKKDRLSIKDVNEGRYYALVGHQHEDTCKRIDILRIGKVLDYDEGIFIPGMNDYLLSSSVMSNRNIDGFGAYSFYIEYFDSVQEAMYAGSRNGDAFIFSHGYFNNPEKEKGALNITDWWKEEYGRTDGKFIPVTQDDMMFLQEQSLVSMHDLIDYFTPKFLSRSEGLRNDEQKESGLLSG